MPSVTETPGPGKDGSGVGDPFAGLGPAEQVRRVAGWLGLFVVPGQVTELRILRWTDDPRGRWAKTLFGYFDHEHLDAMARAALLHTRHAEGVYFIPNPINPDLLARACNRVLEGKQGRQTTDADILGRRWLYVDADPLRPAGISSTDAEKAAAWEVVGRTGDYLGRHGICDGSILADSGNGYHLHLPIDLPVDDGGACRELLAGLADRFDSDGVKLDRKVFNPARICKLYGTLARKGDPTPGRPHRRAVVVEDEG
jgi:hypothetical protein